MFVCIDKVWLWFFLSVWLVVVRADLTNKFCRDCKKKEGEPACALMPTRPKVEQLSMCDNNELPRCSFVLTAAAVGSAAEPVRSVNAQNNATFEYCTLKNVDEYLVKVREIRPCWYKVTPMDLNSTNDKQLPSNLVPDEKYDVFDKGNHTLLYKMLTASHIVYPSPVQTVTVSHISSHDIELNWEESSALSKQNLMTRIFIITRKSEWPLDDNMLKFEVKWSENCNADTKQCKYTFDNLQPFTAYYFSVKVQDTIHGKNISSKYDITCSWLTKEAAPFELNNITKVEAQPRSILFRWTLPEHNYNSKCVNFTATVSEDGKKWSTAAMHVTQDEDKDMFKGNITDLVPGRKYYFNLSAANEAGKGNFFHSTWCGGPTVLPTWNMNHGAAGKGLQRSTEETLPIHEPPTHFAYVNELHATTSTTITINVHKKPHADINGNLIQYNILVSGSKTNINVTSLLTWDRVQDEETWPPYEIKVPQECFLNKTSWNFTIGDGSCSNHPPELCNGPLKPDTYYFIRIRGYTTSTLYTDIPRYWLKIQTKVDNTPLLASLCALCALAVCIWGALLWWSGAGQRLRERLGCAGAAPALVSRPALTTRPVRLRHFPKYVRIMLHDTPEKFTEQFGGLNQVGRDQSCTAAELSCNRPKNRFTNILPYDHSRFKLQPLDDEEGSDYINANYVPGYHSQKDFIATQGPMAHTRNDFWRMCWESETCAIVMLTRCIEKNMEKCDHYWPYDHQPISYGNISVATLSSKNYCNWTISELLISKGEEKRAIKHLQFTTWPDFGVPNPPSTLLQFVSAFREQCPPTHKPIVVHCSAGVGRSGTFIALDRLMQQLQSRAEYLDVLGLVHGMRRARAYMVQTEQQFVCVHVCIACVLEALETCRRRHTVIARAPPPSPPPTTYTQQVHYNLAFEGPHTKPSHSSQLRAFFSNSLNLGRAQ